MRKIDKKLKIQKANLLFEQRYLSDKGVEVENKKKSIKESVLTEAKFDLNNENEVLNMKTMLYNIALENLPQLNYTKTGDKATANDNKVIFITQILPGFFKSNYIPLDYRQSDREIWTNNSDMMREYLSSIGQNPEEYTFWDSSDNQI